MRVGGDLHTGGVARIRLPTPCSTGRLSACGAQPAAGPISPTCVYVEPSLETASANGGPHTAASFIVATKVRCACGGITLTPIGPHWILLPSATQVADPSLPVVPPMKVIPGGAVTVKPRHGVVPAL